MASTRRHIIVFLRTIGKKIWPKAVIATETNIIRRTTNSFSSLRKDEHLFHRRRISAVYTKSALVNSPQLAAVTEKVLVGRLLPVLLGHALTSQSVDVLELSYSLCLDLGSCFLFGYSAGSKFLVYRESTRNWLEHYARRHCEESFWPQELPRLTRCLQMIGINLLPREHYKSTEYIEQWMMSMCDKADQNCSLAEKGQLLDCEDEPVVYRHVKKVVESDLNQADTRTKRQKIASELFDHLCTLIFFLHDFNDTLTIEDWLTLS